MYLSPNRHLLYVTDTIHPTNEGYAHTSHVFEHLSCFLPGLLALGAHTLPLDNLRSAGIDLRSLTEDNQYGFAGRNHRRVSNWNLKQLHMWAAEGLAQTCWLSYADQPTGLGPDEMQIQGQIKLVWNAKEELWIHNDIGLHWLDAMEKWKQAGSHSAPPGVGFKSPVHVSFHETTTRRGRKRDYLARKPDYLLRPEVCGCTDLFRWY